MISQLTAGEMGLPPDQSTGPVHHDAGITPSPTPERAARPRGSASVGRDRKPLREPPPNGGTTDRRPLKIQRENGEKYMKENTDNPLG